MNAYQIASLVFVGLTFVVFAGGLLALHRKVRKDEPKRSSSH